MFMVDEIVFTKIKHNVSGILKTKYPNLSFTMDDKLSKDPSFPTVYVHLLSSPERGQDLEGKTINAGYFTFQIEVTDNQTQRRAKEVIECVLLEMKKMRFEINFPELQSTNDYYRCVARCSRLIGSGDIL